jgi:hypothetical protein
MHFERDRGLAVPRWVRGILVFVVYLAVLTALTAGISEVFPDASREIVLAVGVVATTLILILASMRWSTLR